MPDKPRTDRKDKFDKHKSIISRKDDRNYHKIKMKETTKCHT